MESSFFYPHNKQPPGDLSPWSLRSRRLRSPGKATATTCCSSLFLDASYLLLSRYFHRVLLPRSPLLLLPPCNSILPEILYTNLFAVINSKLIIREKKTEHHPGGKREKVPVFIPAGPENFPCLFPVQQLKSVKHL